MWRALLRTTDGWVQMNDERNDEVNTRDAARRKEGAMIGKIFDVPDDEAGLGDDGEHVPHSHCD